MSFSYTEALQAGRASVAAAQLASATVGHVDALGRGHRRARPGAPGPGRFGWPRWGTGRQVGRVGLDQQPVERAERRRGPQVVGRLERDDAAERQADAEVEAPAGLVGPAGEAVEHRALAARPRPRGCRRCRPTPRGCGSPAPGRARGPGRSGRRTPRAGRRGASGRSGSRGRTPPRPRPRARRAARPGRRRPSAASWGCTPAVAHTPSWAAGPPRWPGGSARPRCRR